MIDLEWAKQLCGGRVTEGGRVRVGYRFDHDDPGGKKTNYITCVVGQIDENIVFAREPPVFPSDPHSEYHLDKSQPPQSSSVGQAQPEFDEDDPEYIKRRDQYLVQYMAGVAGVMAKKDMQSKKRGPEDDSRYHPARRPRTRE
jgi:hypothetical protein